MVVQKKKSPDFKPPEVDISGLYAYMQFIKLNLLNSLWYMYVILLTCKFSFLTNDCFTSFCSKKN